MKEECAWGISELGHILNETREQSLRGCKQSKLLWYFRNSFWQETLPFPIALRTGTWDTDSSKDFTFGSSSTTQLSLKKSVSISLKKSSISYQTNLSSKFLISRQILACNKIYSQSMRTYKRNKVFLRVCNFKSS